jgi:hypothetical protein
MLTCECKRCGRTCQVAERRDEESQPVRKSLVPDGCCLDCAITCFCKTGPLADVLPGGRSGAAGFTVGDVLRMPHVQDQFAAVFRAGGGASMAGEVDWERVIANWDLPAPPGWDWGGEMYMSAGRKRRRK